MPVAMQELAVHSYPVPTYSEKGVAAARRKVGRIIRRNREAAELTQRDLGFKLPRQCDGNQVSRWERGENTPDVERMNVLVRLLHLDRDQDWSWDLWVAASLRKPKERRRAAAATGSERRRLLELAERAAEVAEPSRRAAPRGESR